MKILIYEDMDNFPTGDNPKKSNVVADKAFIKKQKDEKSFLEALSEIDTRTVAHVVIEKEEEIIKYNMVRFVITSIEKIDRMFFPICGLHHFDIHGNYVADVDGVFSMNHGRNSPEHKERNKKSWKAYFLKAFKKIREEKEKELEEISKTLMSLSK